MNLGYLKLNLSAELLLITQLLHRSHLDSVALKGPVLSLELYGDLGARQSKDIDILVRQSDLLKADQLVQTMGYERYQFTPRQLKSHLCSSKDFVYWHPQKRIYLELHWKLFETWDCFDPFETPLKTTQIGGVSIQSLSPEYNLIYLSVHGCESMWSDPKWALDIEKLVVKYTLDWDLIHRELKRFDLEGAFYDRRVRPKPYVWRFSDWLHRFWLRKRFKNRAKVLLSLLVPRTEDFKAISLPDSFFYLYYLFRPWIAMKRNLSRR